MIINNKYISYLHIIHNVDVALTAVNVKKKINYERGRNNLKENNFIHHFIPFFVEINLKPYSDKSNRTLGYFNLVKLMKSSIP